jgi:hypothetical protein
VLFVFNKWGIFPHFLQFVMIGVNVMDTVEALMLVASLKLEPFDKSDYMSYSGVTSKNPMIAYTDDYTVIVDGDEIEIIGDEGETVILARLRER